MNDQPQNHKEIIALIKRISGQANFIGTPRIYVDIFSGDLIAAVWFNQVVYWEGKTSEPIGFYKTYAEWKKELGLSEFQVRRVANLCQVRGLVNITFKKVYGTPKNHYLVIWPELLNILRSTLDVPDPVESEGSLTKGSEGAESAGSLEGEDSSGSLSIEEIPTESEIMKIWNVISSSLEKEMDRGTKENYLKTSLPVSIEDGLLTVVARDEKAREWMEERLTSTMERLLVGILNLPDPKVKFVLNAEVPA